MLRMATWGLFLGSALFWVIGWMGAANPAIDAGDPNRALGILTCWGLGWFLGGLWLLLAIVRLIARIWHGEKARAAHQ